MRSGTWINFAARKEMRIFFPALLAATAAVADLSVIPFADPFEDYTNAIVAADGTDRQIRRLDPR